MIAKARAVVDDNERLKAYKDIQKYLADKVYGVTGFGQQNMFSMLQPWVHGYEHSVTYGVFAETFAKLWLKK